MRNINVHDTDFCLSLFRTLVFFYTQYHIQIDTINLDNNDVVLFKLFRLCTVHSVEAKIALVNAHSLIFNAHGHMNARQQWVCVCFFFSHSLAAKIRADHFDKSDDLKTFNKKD